MKIVNFELNPNEDVSINQTGHCGGTCFSRYAKEILNRDGDEFWIVGQASNFKNISGNERVDRLIQVTPEIVDLIKKGFPIKRFGPLFDDVDIIIHNYSDVSVNTDGLKAKQVCWYSFVNQQHHPNTPYCFVYSDDQNVIKSTNITTMKVKIGKPVAKNFSPTKKKDLLFQCTRNDSTMDTAVTAKLCIKYGIKGVFAGPILNGYNLLDYIDNKNTYYIGNIPEQEKIHYCRNARLYGCIQNWDTIFSLSAVEALGQGTPIIARNRGCFKYLVENGKNGFYFDSDESFLDAWNKSVDINQWDCYNKASEYSEIEMVNSFYEKFKEILC